jgi:uncharacterized OB-fold protein
MSNQKPFTIEQFYKFIIQKKLMAGKCTKCGKMHMPPRPLCDNCFSTDFEWVEVSGKGQLLTYTIIHIAPPKFQSLTPYAVGIVQLENGIRIPGILSGIPLDQINIGMMLSIDFEECNITQQWPQWSRYCFRQT